MKIQFWPNSYGDKEQNSKTQIVKIENKNKNLTKRKEIIYCAKPPTKTKIKSNCDRT